MTVEVRVGVGTTSVGVRLGEEIAMSVGVGLREERSMSEGGFTDPGPDPGACSGSPGVCASVLPTNIHARNSVANKQRAVHEIGFMTIDPTPLYGGYVSRISDFEVELRHGDTVARSRLAGPR